MTKNYVFFNGGIVPQENAKVSYLDRGLRFGDGLFETIRIYNKKPYGWQSHINRLSEGLKKLKINLEVEHLKENFCDVIEKNDMVEGLGKIIITAGDSNLGYARDPESKPNIIIETTKSAIKFHEPIDVFISRFVRPPENMLPCGFKTLCNYNSVLAKQEAIENGCHEAIQLDCNGYISELSSGNVFWLKQGKLYTPSLECNIIPGIVRSFLIDNHASEVNCGKFVLKDILHAEEVFLTNVNYLILPIKKIGNIWNGQDFSRSKEIFNEIVLDIKKECI